MRLLTRLSLSILPAILGPLLLLLAGGSPRPLQAAEQPVLRIFNWEDYLEPELAAEFGRRHGVKVQETYFESDSEMDRRLADRKGKGFDLVLVDAGRVPIYRDRGWLAPIGGSRVPGLVNMQSRWRGAAAEATATHGFPFSWGILAIAYRADLVPDVPDSWQHLFRPDAATCGKVQASSDPRELLAVALKAGGDSANSTDPEAYLRAEQLLRAQKPCVVTYLTTAYEADAPLVTGLASVAMVYNGDAVALRKLNPNIRFVMPREGAMLFADYLVVLASSTQKPLAYAFLQFMSEPANAARQSLFGMTATPNGRGQAMLAPSIRNDRTIYPSDADLKAAEQIQRPSPAMVSKINQIFAKIVPRD